jgi:hypothetical protein
MNIEKHARLRMFKGAANHPDQTWEEMTPGVRVAEALEELADTWNYVEDFKNKKLIRDLLEIIYYEVKQNERNTKEEPRASNGGL